MPWSKANKVAHNKPRRERERQRTTTYAMNWLVVGDENGEECKGIKWTRRELLVTPCLSYVDINLMSVIRNSLFYLSRGEGGEREGKN